jgi:signal recognition particle GTPase
MGHYFSEMCCETCGNLPCNCSKPIRKDLSYYYIEIDVNIYSARIYIDKIYTNTLKKEKSYQTEEEAKSHLKEAILEKIQSEEKKHETKIRHLMNLLEANQCPK